MKVTLPIDLDELVRKFPRYREYDMRKAFAHRIAENATTTTNKEEMNNSNNNNNNNNDNNHNHNDDDNDDDSNDNNSSEIFYQCAKSFLLFSTLLFLNIPHSVLQSAASTP